MAKKHGLSQERFHCIVQMQCASRQLDCMMTLPARSRQQVKSPVFYLYLSAGKMASCLVAAY